MTSGIPNNCCLSHQLLTQWVILESPDTSNSSASGCQSKYNTPTRNDIETLDILKSYVSISGCKSMAFHKLDFSIVLQEQYRWQFHGSQKATVRAARWSGCTSRSGRTSCYVFRWGLLTLRPIIFAVKDISEFANALIRSFELSTNVKTCELRRHLSSVNGLF